MKRYTYKVQFKIGEYGRTQEEYVDTSSDTKPSKSKAKDMILNRPGYSMTDPTEMDVMSVKQVDSYKEGGGMDGMGNIPGL